MSFRSTIGRPRRLAFASVALLAVLAGADEEPPLDRFQCYRTSGFCAADSPRRAGAACEGEKTCGGADGETAFCRTPQFQGRSLALADRFESARFDVRKPLDLCNPATADGMPPDDPEAHLRGYDVLRSQTEPPQPEHSPVRGLRIENELHPATGELVVDTVKPERLMIPSAKSHGEPVSPPAPGAHELEPMQCYKVELAPGSPELSKSVRVAIDDQFAQPKVFRPVKPSRLCVPTSLDRRAVDERAADLLCYLVQPEAAVCAAGSPRNAGGACSKEADCGGTKGKTSLCATTPPHVRVAGLRTANELAEERFDTIREEELCLPSRAIGGAVDRDGDGHSSADDCDDGDAGVHPGAPETCDGRDEDCDGEIDEGLGETTCGIGVCERTVAHCLEGEPRSCVPGEASPEVCASGADEDCDGEIDDAAECSPTCVSGTPCRTDELGVCGDGATACPDGRFGATACIADGEPAAETCDGLDEDCDGETDEGLGETTCGVGACARTIANCLGGEPRVCTPGEPGEEICGDDVDEDCDGVAELCPVCVERSCCDTGLGGECARGRTACLDGSSGAPVCMPAASAANELRNGDFELAVAANEVESNGWSSSGIAAEGGWSESGGSPGGFFTLLGERATASDPAVCQTVSCADPGRTYALGGRYRSVDPAAGDPAKTDALAVTVDGTLVLGLARPSPDPLVWTPFATSFAAPSSSFEICLAAERDGDASSFDVDEIVLEDPSTEEICNGEDDDCDGEIDEGDACASPTPTEAPTVVPTPVEPTPTPAASPTATPPAPVETATPTATRTPTPTPTRSAGCIDPPPGLVIWLSGDGTTEDIARDPDGTTQFAAPLGDAGPGGTVGPPPGYAPGMVGQAFSLNGTDQVYSLPDRADQYPGAGSFTIDAWVQTTRRDRSSVVSKWENGRESPAGANSFMEIYVFDGVPGGQIRDSDATGGGTTFASGTTSVADGAFHHVAMVRDVAAGRLRFYVDGVLEGDAPLLANADGSIRDDDGMPDHFDVGGLAVSGSFRARQFFFAGQIDEVQYFDRALATEEIQSIFAAGGQGQCKEGRGTGVCNADLPCSTGAAGICAEGRTSCPDGPNAPAVCQPDRRAVEEVCASGTDDDCDGETDESECREDARPLAVDDAYDARAGETLAVAAAGVLANDSDPEGQPLGARLAGLPLAGEVTLEPDGSFAYTPDAIGTGAVHEDVNLTMLLRPTVAASSASFDLALGRTSEASLINGDTIRSWCTSEADRNAWAEEVFPQEITVREIRYFAVNDGSFLRNFTTGVFELLGPTGTLLFATPEVTFVLPTTQNWPAPAPSTLVDVETMAGGPVAGVRRVRFRATGYQQSSGTHCASELHVHGDSLLASTPAPAEVNLGELDSSESASGAFSDIHRPEAANDENPSTAWYASAGSGAFYEFAFPVGVTATRLELDGPFVQPGGGAQSGNIRCGGRIELFDANDVVLFDSGPVTIDTANASQRSFPFPNVGAVRRARLTQTEPCSLYQVGLAAPMGFAAIRLIGPPPVPLPRFELFERYRVAGAAHSTPLVANLTDHNGDGRVDRLDVPDVLAIVLGSPTVQSGFIQAVRGDDGMAVFTAGAPNLVSSFSEPAIGDIDGDGLPEIVAVHADGNHLIAFENDGTEKWVSEAHPQPRAFIGSTAVVTGAVAIANLDGAGAPEIVVGAAVYDAEGNLLADGAALGGTSGGGTSAGGPKRAAISAIADVDLDGVAEIVAGPTVYEVRSGGLFKQWQRADRADGFVGIANFDTDPEAEIVVVANGEIYMLNHDGSDAEVWNPPTRAPIPLPVGGSGGPPTIGDLDGDGTPEIGVAGFWGYAAFRRDGTVLWRTAISDYSSNSTGSTVFDFERDGSVEVLYRDERWLRVYRGKDGFLLGKRLVASTTWTELPVVADVDGDGDGEIVVVGEGGSAGITVFEDVGGGFAPTRRIWNQHAYSITNVNEDGTIPPAASPNWLAPGLNDFRLNAFGPDDVRDREDSFTYVANDGGLDSDPAVVRIRVEANRPPVFVSTPPTRAGAGIRYSYAARVSDPDPGDALAFSLPLGPEGMAIDPASGLVGWTPTAAQTGEHPVTIRVADEDGNVALQKYAVTVGESGAEDVDDDGDGLSENEGDCNDADPTIRPGILDPPGDGIDQDCDGADDADRRTTDDDGDGVSENEGDCNDAEAGTYPGAPDPPGDGIDQDCTGADGDDPALADLDGDGFSVAFGDCDDTDPSVHPGAFDIPGDGFDQNCNGADSIEGDDAPPVAAIATPADLADVTAPTDVVGTAADEHFLRYTLEVASVDDPTATTVIGSGTSAVANGVLGRLDPTLLENGLYLVRLTVEDVNGNLTTDEVVYAVGGEMKVGNFRLSYTDLSIPVSGIPITIVRTYDSRVKTKEDFGVGWTLDVHRGSAQSNRKPGDGFRIDKAPGAFGLPCQIPTETKTHLTTVRLSDREVYRFVPRPRNTTAIAGGCLGEIAFEFVSGPTPRAELQILGETDFFNPNGVDRLYTDETETRIYDPGELRLVLADGRKIDLDRAAGGIIRLEDTNGNTLTISPSGISHGSGKSVSFERDGLGRVAAITDPIGHTLRYVYDERGDLIAASDALGNRTEFTYDARHNLLAIRDPSGRQPLRTEFDEDGRMVAVIDGRGNRTDLIHDVEARVDERLDALGHRHRYFYDDRGFLTRQVQFLTIEGAPVVAVTQFEHDDAGNETTIVDADGVRYEATYDHARPLQEVVDPGGLALRTSYAYDAGTRPLSLGNAAGAVVSMSYDLRGNLTRWLDPGGAETTYDVDLQGRPTRKRDALGATVDLTYDGAGNVLRREVKSAAGELLAKREFTYDANGNVTSETSYKRVDGALQPFVTTYVHDANGQLVEARDPLGQTSRIEYDPRGLVAAEIDALGRRTSYTYDEVGALVRTDFPDGTVETLDYDAVGNVIRRTDQKGEITAFAYDERRKRIRTVLPEGGVYETVYTPAGRVAARIDPNGGRTDFVYDGGGRRVAMILPEVFDAARQAFVRPEIRHELDGVGKPIAEVDANGNRTEIFYDSAGRPLRTLYADGTARERTFDVLGRLVEIEDEDGNRTRFDYDSAGKVIAVTDPLLGETAYAYDEHGNLLEQTDALGRVSRSDYDALDRLTVVTRPGGETETFAYDAVGNRIARTDANGNTTRFSYDSMNRLVRTEYADGSAHEFAYTATGRRASATDERGATLYEYDRNDRLIRVRHPHGEQVGYAYDPAGRLRGLASPAGATSYGRDPLGRLSSVLAGFGETTYAYDAVGNAVSTTLPSGITTTRRYDSRNRMIEIHHRRGGTTVASYAYSLSPAGRRLEVTEADGSVERYEYDALGRLVGEERLGTAPRTLAYEYDAVGNRTHKVANGEVTSYAYDENDRLLSAGSDSFTYDDEGNLTSRATAGTTIVYGWNPANRLASVGTPSSFAEFRYDADGNRVERRAGGTVARYLVDAGNPTGFAQVLEERDAAGALAAAYTYGRDLVAIDRAGEVAMPLTDALGSTRLLADSGGSVTDEYAYDAYGSLTSRTGSDPNSYLFAGEEFESGSGLYYLRSRWMDPTTGRFVSRDAFPGVPSEPLSLHRYLYANADPTNRTDPSGFHSAAELAAVQGIVSTLVTLSNSIVRFYQFVDSAIRILEAMQIIVDVFDGGFTGGLDSAAEALSNEAEQVMQGLDPEQAVNELAGNLNEIARRARQPWASYLLDTALPGGYGLKAFTIYLPALHGGARNSERSLLQGDSDDGRRGRVRTPRRHLPVEIVRGGPGSRRLTGAGVKLGAGKKSDAFAQIFRMEFHPTGKVRRPPDAVPTTGSFASPDAEHGPYQFIVVQPPQL